MTDHLLGMHKILGSVPRTLKEEWGRGTLQVNQNW